MKSTAKGIKRATGIASTKRLLLDHKISDVVLQMIERPYSLGQTDCLSFYLDFYESCGVEMPQSWRGWTRANYVERWKRGEGLAEIYEFLHSLGTEVTNLNYLRQGDLLIGDAGDCAYPYIYLWGCSVLTVTEKSGIRVVPYAAVKKRIFEARRLFE